MKYPIFNTLNAASCTLYAVIPSTNVEIALQIHSILTNKPNFPHFSPKNDDFTKNKPNSNPIQTQFDERAKLMQSLYLQRIMKKYANMGQKKQTQNKPNQTQSAFLQTCSDWDFVDKIANGTEDISWIELIIDSY